MYTILLICENSFKLLSYKALGTFLAPAYVSLDICPHYLAVTYLDEII